MTYLTTKTRLKVSVCEDCKRERTLVGVRFPPSPDSAPTGTGTGVDSAFYHRRQVRSTVSLCVQGWEAAWHSDTGMGGGEVVSVQKVVLSVVAKYVHGL